ncbi:MAG: 3D domain-containing protein [Peptoniphilaceae bacterium]|uniref:3D domain-containing protein n=1 Tax=Parvimonas sp. TaxID=1944660 RepID=UPI0025CD2979|nr:3D domain-containing protein [Parvimonas sp.]MDD7764254.1 3D domain-containing protein [Peptoniphilaceae bacterium]MDY3051517.1 3D domain-containing protein [Parvimonas sp.]
MKRAVFKLCFVVLCIYATVSGFSYKSFANEKVRGFVVSSDSDVETLKKVNDRIVKGTNGSENINSYIVNIDNKIDFTLAGLLSLNNNGVVVPIRNNEIDKDLLETLKSSKQIYVVGDTVSVSDEILKKANLDFKRLGTSNIEDTNKIVNEFSGNKDLLVVDKKINSDIVGAFYYAYIYNMNLLLVDSEAGLSKSEEDVISKVDKDGYIYFYDGVSTISRDYKTKIYNKANKDVNLVESYTFYEKDVFKIFKDRFDIKDSGKKVILTQTDVLSDMLYSYILSEKLGHNFLLITGEDNSYDVADMIKTSNVEEMTFISTFENNRFVSIRQLMSSVNEEEFSNFELTESGNEIVSTTKSEEQKQGEKVSEEVSVKSDEVLVDGKVVSKEQIEKEKEKSKVQEEKQELPSTNASVDFNYKEVKTMVATAYSADPSENGGYSTTKLGTKLRYGVIAVDPSVIPLGTKVYVEGYGYAIAEDTGGAIKGNKIDVCIPNKDQVFQFGVKKVKVYILP